MAETRAAAARAVADVLSGRSLSDALPQRLAGLEGRDRALAAELANGVCRWEPRLSAILARLLSKPIRAKELPVKALLLVGVYQILHTRVSQHAAVDRCVAAAVTLRKDWAKGLVNAVLRRLLREQSVLLAEVDRNAAKRFALPNWLWKAVDKRFGSEAEAVARALLERPRMTLRVNRRHGDRDHYRQRLTDAGLSAQPHPLAADALMLSEPVDVERLPGFAVGDVSVQDAGAQLAAGLLAPQAGQRVLDACAAPGGKTGHLLERHDQIDLQAVDVSAERLTRVRSNLDRLGLAAQLSEGDAAQPASWAQGTFQRILLDVPCSATGVISRHPDIKLLRRSSDIAGLAKVQLGMLRAIWPYLEAGGRLLYVTCSILPQENEAIVTEFLTMQTDARVLDLPGEIGHQAGVGRQLAPGLQDTDGFFYALLEKTG